MKRCPIQIPNSAKLSTVIILISAFFAGILNFSRPDIFHFYPTLVGNTTFFFLMILSLIGASKVNWSVLPDPEGKARFLTYVVFFMVAFFLHCCLAGAVAGLVWWACGAKTVVSVFKALQVGVGLGVFVFLSILLGPT